MQRRNVTLRSRKAARQTNNSRRLDSKKNTSGTQETDWNPQQPRATRLDKENNLRAANSKISNEEAVFVDDEAGDLGSEFILPVNGRAVLEQIGRNKKEAKLVQEKAKDQKAKDQKPKTKKKRKGKRKEKRIWKPEEDEKLKRLIRETKPFKWSLIASKMEGREGKQCRERWYNHLNPEIVKGPWSQSEEWLLYLLHRVFGNQWSDLTKMFRGRTDNSIKNHWNSIMKRKVADCRKRCDGLLKHYEQVFPETVKQLGGAKILKTLHKKPKKEIKKEETRERGRRYGLESCLEIEEGQVEKLVVVETTCQLLRHRGVEISQLETLLVKRIAENDVCKENTVLRKGRKKIQNVKEKEQSQRELKFLKTTFRYKGVSNRKPKQVAIGHHTGPLDISQLQPEIRIRLDQLWKDKTQNFEILERLLRIDSVFSRKLGQEKVEPCLKFLRSNFERIKTVMKDVKGIEKELSSSRALKLPKKLRVGHRSKRSKPYSISNRPKVFIPPENATLENFEGVDGRRIVNQNNQSDHNRTATIGEMNDFSGLQRDFSRLEQVDFNFLFDGTAAAKTILDLEGNFNLQKFIRTFNFEIFNFQINILSLNSVSINIFYNF